MADAKLLAKAKWIVEQNAYLQAKNDAMTIPYGDVYDIVTDQPLKAAAINMIQTWAMSPKVDVIFTQLPKEELATLDDQQRQDLIDYWCMRYPELVYQFLSKRLENHG